MKFTVRSKLHLPSGRRYGSETQANQKLAIIIIIAFGKFEVIKPPFVIMQNSGADARRAADRDGATIHFAMDGATDGARIAAIRRVVDLKASNEERRLIRIRSKWIAGEK